MQTDQLPAKLRVTDYRAQYIRVNDQGVVCTGTKAECDYLLEDGATFVPWGEPISAEVCANMVALYVQPSATQLKKAKFPLLAGPAPLLQFIYIPYPLLFRLEVGHIPKVLECLMLCCRASDKPLLPEQRHLPDGFLGGLQGLFFMGDEDAASTWYELGLSGEALPQLQYLHTPLYKAERLLEVISGLRSLRYLELTHLGKMEVFSHLPADLQGLSINSTGNTFPTANLGMLQKLESLSLNAVKSELDCAVFKSMRSLRVLDIYSTKKLHNIEALLECPHLQSVEFVDCGRPFKGELKQGFEAHGFAHLSIKYA